MTEQRSEPFDMTLNEEALDAAVKQAEEELGRRLSQMEYYKLALENVN